MEIAGFNKTTLLDYPHHLASTIFLRGCDFRCPFCHNSSLVLPSKNDGTYIPEQEVFAYLEKRSSILEGVCITGGEPTLHQELFPFIKKIKELGLKVKLDTNGNHPDILASLIKEHLIDSIAMDIKNSLTYYDQTINLPNFNTINIEASVSLIQNSAIPYEFRTTIVKEFHNKERIKEIAAWLKGSKLYVLQSFKDTDDIIGSKLSAHTKETLVEFQSIASSYIKKVFIRGID